MIPVIRDGKPADLAVLFELQALRLGLYGMEGIDRRAIRRLRHSRWWLETRFLLQAHGATEAEIAHLMDIHPRGCPCWRCVRQLNRWAKAQRDKLKKKAAGPKVGG